MVIPQKTLPTAWQLARTMRSVLSLFTGICLAVSGMAAQVPNRQTPPLRVDADLYRFSGADSTTFVEIAYGFPESALTYRKDSTGFTAGADMALEIRTEGRTVASRSWSIPRTIPESLANLAAQNILSIETVTLPAGEYTAVLFCRDRVDSLRRDSVLLSIRADVGAGDVVALSDIELCSGITPSEDRSSLFYKNTLNVIPNPGRLYGGGLSTLWFYAEVYNLMATGSRDVVLRAAIVDPSGAVVASSSKTKPRANNSSVEYGSMNVSSLPGGSYVFRLSVVDSASSSPRVLASGERKFFLLQPETRGERDYGPPTGSVDEFTLMTTEAVDDEIRKITYIASEPERQQIDGLGDPLARLNFLRNFWQGRDPDPVTAGNEARSAYLDRVGQANGAYTERGREGWLTDRGRVFILYGVPDDIQRHPNESETHPYEIWNYNDVQGGVEFVFVDVLGFGRYRLVHSSHLDELRNDDWYNQEAKIR